MSYYSSTTPIRRGFWIENGDFKLFLVSDDIAAMTKRSSAQHTKIYLRGGGELEVPIGIDKLIEGWKGAKLDS